MPYASLIKAKPNDVVVMLSGHANEAVGIVQMIRDIGISSIIFGPDALSKTSFIDGLHHRSSPTMDYTKNILISSPLLYDSANADALAYKEHYERIHQMSPDWRGAFFYI